MIKKIIACLTICFIITGIISPVFSDASALPQPNWNDPGISEIINISDLTGWMLNGGTYDVSTYTDAESFMNDYYSARTKTRLEGSDYVVKHYYGIEEQYYDIGDSAYVHPLDINRAISTSFRDHSGYGRRFSEQVNDALLSTGHLYDTKIPLLNEIEFANFVGYNHNALNLYKGFFKSEDIVMGDVPLEYQQYLDNINYNLLYWDRVNASTTAGYITLNQDWDSNSWISNPNLVYGVSNGPFYVAPSNGIIDINISGTGDHYSFTSTGTFQRPFAYVNDPNSGINPDWNSSNTVFFYQNAGGYQIINTGEFNAGTWSYSYTGTLGQCLSYLQYRFFNVNIYVNGELWSYVGGTPQENIPEFPDVVGGEDLPATTWPISRPRAPYYTNVPGVLQAIEDAIADDGKLDIDDLKPYLTDANGDPVPDPIFDPEPIPIPVPDPVNPDIVPGLPILPAIPPNMPGFNGVSVLAEIINFTNQSLPTSLIVTFWGIVFGIVILGLIKILHK